MVNFKSIDDAAEFIAEILEGVLWNDGITIRGDSICQSDMSTILEIASRHFI